MTEEQATPTNEEVLVRITSDGTAEGTKIVTLPEEHDISRFCMGAQIIIKPTRTTEAVLYLAAPLADLIVKGRIQVWEDVRRGYNAAERARVCEELVYFKQGLNEELQKMFDVAIADIADRKTREIMDAEKTQKPLSEPDLRTREDA
jgi:hypothetical protein